MTRLSVEISAAAIRDKAYFEEMRKRVVDTREWTKKELTRLGFTFGDSKTNFIFAKHKTIPGEVFDELRKSISLFVVLEIIRELKTICVFRSEHKKRWKFWYRN